MTQRDLAAAVGVQFQQIQKYEIGANRVSASRLWSIARVQGVEVAYYFEGLDEADLTGQELVPELFKDRTNRDALGLLEISRRLPTEQRTKLIALAKAMADERSRAPSTE